MAKQWMRWIAAALVFAGGSCVASANTAETAAAPSTAEVVDKAPPAVEGKTAPAEVDAGSNALAFLKSLEFSGGVSAGWFYASNPGPHTSDNEPLVSNFLIGLAGADRSALVGFEAGIGETSTPSVLSPPEPNRDFKVEYASVILRPLPGGEFVVGLLKPCAGYEDTYTYNNRNVVHGIVAAQQPYNAYGARAKYSIAGIDLTAGYYSKRLAEDEYAVDRDGDGESDREARRSWEVGVGGESAGLGYHAYHYQVEGMKSLTGAVLEYLIANVYVALNADYWRWHKSMSGFHERKHAEGVALYVVPSFGSFSVPVRLEYVNQGGSRIYTEGPDTRTLWSVTITPTYRVSDKAYVRFEGSFVGGTGAFSDDDGRPKDSRVYLAGELGYVF